MSLFILLYDKVFPAIRMLISSTNLISAGTTYYYIYVCSAFRPSMEGAEFGKEIRIYFSLRIQ